ncbi:nicotinate-nucleotide adenylyltransferase [Tundrisphaera lichenicola]|uniref:nicotinate-nucleotide adenylyltransferase n=1 Tax=Tundrisphaera lichenicola TaxID=2029860 RepID=UPI003EB834D7
MRLGLYGGTFDPIHLGHLILAEACREACELDRVWFVVSGSPPHKPEGRTAVDHRVEMVRLAVAGHPAFEVSEIETRRPGPHYSVDTLEVIRRERPEDELFFLIGADSLVDLPHWREPGQILRMATLVVANRPGFEPTLPELPAGARPIRRVTIPPIGLASHEIRRRRREGRSIRYQVPRAVEAYIEAHGLYPPEVASGPDRG